MILFRRFSNFVYISTSVLIMFFCLVVVLCEMKRNGKYKVIIDTDGGPDDAMALLMLLSPKSNVEVVAITCVTGNTVIDTVVDNIFKTLDIADRLDIPVYLGSNHGLVYPMTFSQYFGQDGFGDFEYPKPINRSSLQRIHAAMAISNLVSKYPGEIKILAIGPLTNIALALHLDSSFKNKVKALIILGGSYQGEGNIRPGIEFNVYMDPEAASVVFSSADQTKITLIPLETVHRAYFSMDWRINGLGFLKSKPMEFLNKAERVVLGKTKDWYCYDPSAAAILLDQHLITGYEEKNAFVETHGNIARGAMFFDTGNSVHLVTSIDRNKLKSSLMYYLSD